MRVESKILRVLSGEKSKPHREKRKDVIKIATGLNEQE